MYIFLVLPLRVRCLCAQALPNVEVAQTLGGVMSSMFSLFAGFLISPAMVPGIYIYYVVYCLYVYIYARVWIEPRERVTFMFPSVFTQPAGNCRVFSCSIILSKEPRGFVRSREGNSEENPLGLGHTHPSVQYKVSLAPD